MYKSSLISSLVLVTSARTPEFPKTDIEPVGNPVVPCKDTHSSGIWLNSRLNGRSWTLEQLTIPRADQRRQHLPCLRTLQHVSLPDTRILATKCWSRPILATPQNLPGGQHDATAMLRIQSSS